MACPDCGTTLVVSPNQTLCDFANPASPVYDPNHGDQTWWDCPECGASWEDEEL